MITASQRVTRVGDGPNRQQKRYPAGRICAAEGCGTVLSVYNASETCNCHHGGEPVPKREYGLPPKSRATARERQERVLALLRTAEPGEWVVRPGDMMQHEWSYAIDALRRCGYKIDGRNKSNGGGYRFAAATEPPGGPAAPQEPSCAATEAMTRALPFHGEEAPARRRPPGTNDATIAEFLKSGLDSARIDVVSRDMGCLRNCLQQRIRKLGLEDQVVAVERKNKVYLIRKAAYDEGLGT
jgi:hypothetical protein